MSALYKAILYCTKPTCSFVQEGTKPTCSRTCSSPFRLHSALTQDRVECGTTFSRLHAILVYTKSHCVLHCPCIGTAIPDGWTKALKDEGTTCKHALHALHASLGLTSWTRTAMQLAVFFIPIYNWSCAWLLTGLPFSGHTISTLARELCMPNCQMAARESELQIC